MVLGQSGESRFLEKGVGPALPLSPPGVNDVGVECLLLLFLFIDIVGQLLHDGQALKAPETTSTNSHLLLILTM